MRRLWRSHSFVTSRYSLGLGLETADLTLSSVPFLPSFSICTSSPIRSYSAVWRLADPQNKYRYEKERGATQYDGNFHKSLAHNRSMIKEYLERKDVDSLCLFLGDLSDGALKDECIKSSCAAMRKEENTNLLIPFALKTIENKLTTNSHHFNSLLHAFDEAGYVSEFAEFIEFLALKGIKFHTKYFTRCARRFNMRNLDQFHKLLSMITTLSKEGIHIPNQVYTHAFNVGVGRNRRNWEAVMTLYEAIEASLHMDNLLNSYEKVVQTLINCNKKTEAIEVLQNISSIYGMKCHDDLIFLMISAEDVDGAVRTTKHAHQINFTLGYEPYFLIGETLSKNNRLHLFDELIMDMIFYADGGAHAYTKAIKIYRDMGLHHKSDEIFSTMISYGIQPSVQAMEVLLSIDTMENVEESEGSVDWEILIMGHFDRLNKEGKFTSLAKLVSAISILENFDMSRYHYALSLCESIPRSIAVDLLDASGKIDLLSSSAPSSIRAMCDVLIYKLSRMKNRSNTQEINTAHSTTLEDWMKRSFTADTGVMLQHRNTAKNFSYTDKNRVFEYLSNPPMPSDLVPLDAAQYNAGIRLSSKVDFRLKILEIMKSKDVTPNEETYHLLIKDQKTLDELYPFVSKLIVEINEMSIPKHTRNVSASIDEERMSILYITKFLRRISHSIIDDLMPLLSQVKTFSTGLGVEELQGMPVPNHIRFLYLLDLVCDLFEAKNKLFMKPHVENVIQIAEACRIAAFFSDSKKYLDKAVRHYKLLMAKEIVVPAVFVLQLYNTICDCIDLCDTDNDHDKKMYLYRLLNDLFNDMPRSMRNRSLSLTYTTEECQSSYKKFGLACDSDIHKTDVRRDNENKDADLTKFSIGSNLHHFMHAHKSHDDYYKVTIDTFHAHLLGRLPNTGDKYVRKISSDSWEIYFDAFTHARNVKKDMEVVESCYYTLGTATIAPYFYDDDFCCNIIRKVAKCADNYLTLCILESIMRARQGNLESFENQLLGKFEIALTYLEEECLADDHLLNRVTMLRQDLPY